MNLALGMQLLLPDECSHVEWIQRQVLIAVLPHLCIGNLCSLAAYAMHAIQVAVYALLPQFFS